MQIVTDSGTDLRLPSGEEAELNVHTVPLTVTLDGISYREGVDIEHKDFYPLLEASDGLPTTNPILPSCSDSVTQRPPASGTRI